jgi:phosphoribosylformylglycinamidine synthase
LNPYVGAKIAIAEAARNLACTGAVPAGVTDCLNFGSPDKPDRYWQFKNAINGLIDACKYFNVPVISGNVSFYNESVTSAIFPTPSIGMVGIIEDISKRMTSNFKDEGDAIVLLGLNKEEIGGSEYLKRIHEKKTGDAPELNMELEKSVQEACIELIGKGLIKSAHDCAEGGLSVCIAESCMRGKIGAEVSLSEKIRTDALLFGESQSRIVVTCDKNRLAAAEKILKDKNIPHSEIGVVRGEKIVVKINGKEYINAGIKETEDIYNNSISRSLGL